MSNDNEDWIVDEEDEDEEYRDELEEEGEYWQAWINLMYVSTVV